MRAKELIEKLKELDQGQDLPVLFCHGSVYTDGYTNIGDVVADPGHFIIIKRIGKFGSN